MAANNSNHFAGSKCCKVNIIAIDVGTTLLNGSLFDRSGIAKYSTSRKIELLYPKPGWVEIDPHVLWEQFQDVVIELIEAGNLKAEDITALGISTQRGTFTTWDKQTGHPLHNFITWQDLRASDHADAWNKSFTLKSLNLGSKFLHMVSRRKQYLAGSVLSFSTQQLFELNFSSINGINGPFSVFNSHKVVMRLHYLLSSDTQIKRKAQHGSLLYGTVDTWILWKLTKGRLFATDYSNASATGMFDPFLLEWSSVLTSMMDIPVSILPQVVDTSGIICESQKDIFGAPIPIRAVVADAQAAMFGQCCFDVGDVKCTLGTASFININTGGYAHASVAGLYPLVGWKIGNKVVYVAEGNSSGTGTAIEWAKQMGFFDDVSRTSDMAFSVEAMRLSNEGLDRDCERDSDGVCFVPAFNGLQAPVNDNTACVSLLGIKQSTKKAHIMRAILESIAFRFLQLYETAMEETHVAVVSSIKADGGVCNNNFVMELTSSLTGQTIDRPAHTNMSVLGAAFLAGLATGVWKTHDELKAIRCTQALFQPKLSIKDKYTQLFEKWKEAVERSRNWYKK